MIKSKAYAKTSVTKKGAIMLSTTHILDLMLRNMSDFTTIYSYNIKKRTFYLADCI